MRDQSSFTAETVALQRAFESHRPPEGRLFDDTAAESFTSGRLRFLARLSRVPAIGGLAPWVYDRVAGPGPRPSAVARTRFIDDVASERAEQVDQFVVLGAGFDTRSHRLAEVGGLTTFEVDHPATQARKRDVVQQLGLRGDHVTYVPVDFEHDRLDECLLAAGLDARCPTLFLWEGVTNYLSASAVDATLAIIRELAAPGSTLVFTYVHVGVLDGSVDFPEAARWLHNVQRAGEPWTFGLRPDEVEEFLRQRGFVLDADVSTREIGDRWFPALGRPDRGSALYRVAVATVG